MMRRKTAASSWWQRTDNAPHIAEDAGAGTAVIEVFEEPRCLQATWTNDAAAWVAGPMALRVLAALNAIPPKEG